MQRVSRSTAVATMPAPPVGGTPGYFTGGNPGLGQDATVPGFEWFNAVQEELIFLITLGGQTPTNLDLGQVWRSMRRLFAGGVNSFNANATLTTDEAGLVLVNASTGPRIITLPAASALGGRPIFYRIVKTDNSANAVTVQRAGTDVIEGGTSVVLGGQWASVTVISDGSGSWVGVRGMPASTAQPGTMRLATAAETDAGTLTDVAVTPAGLGIATRNYANPGYARLPGGLMVQFAKNLSLAANSSVFVTLPIAFPNEILSGFAGIELAVAGTNPPQIGWQQISLSQIRIWNGSASNAAAVSWFIIGR